MAAQLAPCGPLPPPDKKKSNKKKPYSFDYGRFLACVFEDYKLFLDTEKDRVEDVPFLSGSLD